MEREAYAAGIDAQANVHGEGGDKVPCAPGTERPGGERRCGGARGGSHARDPEGRRRPMRRGAYNGSRMRWWHRYHLASIEPRAWHSWHAHSALCLCIAAASHFAIAFIEGELGQTLEQLTKGDVCRAQREAS